MNGVDADGDVDMTIRDVKQDTSQTTPDMMLALETHRVEILLGSGQNERLRLELEQKHAEQLLPEARASFESNQATPAFRDETDNTTRYLPHPASTVGDESRGLLHLMTKQALPQVVELSPKSAPRQDTQQQTAQHKELASVPLVLPRECAVPEVIMTDVPTVPPTVHPTCSRCRKTDWPIEDQTQGKCARCYYFSVTIYQAGGATWDRWMAVYKPQRFDPTPWLKIGQT